MIRNRCSAVYYFSCGNPVLAYFRQGEKMERIMTELMVFLDTNIRFSFKKYAISEEIKSFLGIVPIATAKIHVNILYFDKYYISIFKVISKNLSVREDSSFSWWVSSSSHHLSVWLRIDFVRLLSSRDYPILPLKRFYSVLESKKRSLNKESKMPWLKLPSQVIA